MIDNNISIVGFLQSVAPHLARQLTEERLAVMKQIADLGTELAATRAKLDRLVAAVPSTNETKDEWIRRHHCAQTDFQELAWNNLMDWRAAIAEAKEGQQR